MTSKIHLQEKQDPAYLGLPVELGKNAFHWRRTPEPPKPMTAKEKNRAYQREYAKSRYVKVADREKAITDFKAYHLSGGRLTESQADKDKTARLRGHSFLGTTP